MTICCSFGSGGITDWRRGTCEDLLSVVSICSVVRFPTWGALAPFFPFFGFLTSSVSFCRLLGLRPGPDVGISNRSLLAASPLNMTEAESSDFTPSSVRPLRGSADWSPLNQLSYILIIEYRFRILPNSPSRFVGCWTFS